LDGEERPWEYGNSLDRFASLCIVYSRCGRDRRSGEGIWSEDPPLTIDECNELLLDVIEVDTFGPESRLPLRVAMKALRKRKRSTIYYFIPVERRSLEGLLVEYLRRNGYVVLGSAQRKVHFWGSTSGKVEAWDHEVLGEVLKHHGFAFKNINEAKSDGLDLVVRPSAVQRSLLRQLSRACIGVDVAIVNLPGADLAIHEVGKWYINKAHPGFMKLAELAQSTSSHEFEVYVRGLLQVDLS
jgi:hypothetical protein